MRLKKRVEILEEKACQSMCDHGWDIVKLEQWSSGRWRICAKCWKCNLFRKIDADKEAVQAIEILYQKTKDENS